MSAALAAAPFSRGVFPVSGQATIVLWMNGGPSALETFVPEHPGGVRGAFRSISTRQPGVRFCEHLPRLAEHADRMVIAAGVVSPSSCHRRAWHYLHNGVPLPLSCEPPPRPAPMLDGLRGRFPEAFRWGTEPERVRRSYGETAFGRACLAARRLVEMGLPYVEVEMDGWDTHSDHGTQLRQLLPVLDQGFAALLTDLRERDLLDRVSVVWMGEFGRTLEVNRLGGRDHDPREGCVVVAGGPLRRGRLMAGDAIPAHDVLAFLASRGVPHLRRAIHSGSLRLTSRLLSSC